MSSINLKTKNILEWVIKQRGLTPHRFERYFAMISFYQDCMNDSVNLKDNALLNYLNKYKKPITIRTCPEARYNLFKDIKANGVKSPVNIFSRPMIDKHPSATIEGTNRIIISYILGIEEIKCLITDVIKEKGLLKFVRENGLF